MIQKIPSGNSLIDPLRIFTQAEVGFGQTVADLGVGGAGYFALQAAKIVGERGRVYGVDIQKSALSNLESRARMAGIHNIITVWSNLEIVGAAKKIANQSIDTALIINVLFQSRDKKDRILAEAYRMLKSGGMLVVVDWKRAGSPLGPTHELRVHAEDIERMATAAGFEMTKRFEPGDYHFGLLFKKA